MNEKKTTISDELEAAVTRTQAAVAALPEDRPLTREQIAAVVEERCVEALSFEAEARSLPAALRAAMLEPGEHEVSLGALAEGLEAAEEATRELRSGSLAAASEQYGQAQRLLECAGLLGCFAHDEIMLEIFWNYTPMAAVLKAQNAGALKSVSRRG